MAEVIVRVEAQVKVRALLHPHLLHISRAGGNMNEDICEACSKPVEVTIIWEDPEVAGGTYTEGFCLADGLEAIQREWADKTHTHFRVLFG